jgi:hypothetical protein
MPLKRAFLVAAILGLIVSCGPSLRRTYESDNAFARCFDMDYDPGAAGRDKEICWTIWLEKRVYNQQEDKIRYARLRLEELEKGISVPGPPGPPGAFDKRPAPEPETSVKLETRKKVKKAHAEEAAPGSECERVCKESLKTCRENCRTDAGVDNFCKNACDESYKTCMTQCFGD